MKCLVKIGFAGLVYAGASGTIIDIPMSEAKSLEHAGIVQILENIKPEIAYETADEAIKGEHAVKSIGKKRK